MPEKYVPRRYSKIAHGAGVGFECPNMPYREDWDAYGFDGLIDEGMALCIESYIGDPDGPEGVKLEQQILVTKNGSEVLSDFPFEQVMLR
jgi:Xaa-Pro aminopeptidase